MNILTYSLGTRNPGMPVDFYLLINIKFFAEPPSPTKPKRRVCTYRLLRHSRIPRSDGRVKYVAGVIDSDLLEQNWSERVHRNYLGSRKIWSAPVQREYAGYCAIRLLVDYAHEAPSG